MLSHCISCSLYAERHVLRLLSISSHTQQAAAVARAFATDVGSEAAGDQVASHVSNGLSDGTDAVFDAAELSAPLRVHQLIGDPRTGVADDTTTAPFGDDISVEHVWRSDTKGIDWFRYSLAGDHLPFMYMDARLSDHSKNMMYMLRCKDPQRWTIPALAEKFRIRRQRVMAILALKEVQAHTIHSGAAMKGPLQAYLYRVPLSDLHLQPDGQPVDLLELVQQQEALQQQQQQQQGPGSTPAAAAVDPLDSAEGLGSLQDFLATEGDGAAGGDTSAGGSSSSSMGVDQAADLAVLMPQVALTAQQLQVQLLQLLQRHHYSIADLQQTLLQQIDMAEAYYNAHVQGTPLEQLLQQQHKADGATAAAAGTEAAAEDSAEEGTAAAAGSGRPAWLDFDHQRQVVQQLLGVLEPLLSSAGPVVEREAGQLLVALTHALQQHQDTQPAAAPAAAAGDSDNNKDATSSPAETEQLQQQQEEQQQPQPQSESAGALLALVKSADAATLAAAFDQLDVARRQQLLDAVPEVAVKLNVSGTDLRAALTGNSSSTSSGESAAGGDDSSSSSSSSTPVGAGEWPLAVPPLLDVWGYEEVPRQQLADLQQHLPAVQELQAAATQQQQQQQHADGSSSRLSAADISAVQQAVLVYANLLRDYDQVLSQQAAQASGGDESAAAAPLPPSAQRRLVRILRDLDGHAVEKLLLWESYWKEADQREADGHKLRRLKERVTAAVKALDQQAVAAGGSVPSGEYPDLPDSTPEGGRIDPDLMAAYVDAEVVGRHFHRGSGDRHFVSVPTYPKFEGMTLQEFDATSESEISIINRLAAERQDNLMWREYRVRLLRNMGLLAPGLHQHSGVVKPPKPQEGWSWVVHPVGGSAKALNRQQLKQQAEQQWLDDHQVMQGQPGGWGGVAAPVDPAKGPAPQAPYVAQPNGTFRQLSEEEALVVGDTKPKPRRRWFANKR